MSGLCHAVLLAVLTAASAQRGVAGPPGGGRRRPGRPGSASGAVRGGAPDAKMRRPPVRHVPPELSQPPLATVTDIKGTRVELPFATSADNAASCVEAFASGARAGGVGNHQNPYSSHGEDHRTPRTLPPNGLSSPVSGLPTDSPQGPARPQGQVRPQRDRKIPIASCTTRWGSLLDVPSPLPGPLAAAL